jgi:hypothetical protein
MLRNVPFCHHTPLDERFDSHKLMAGEVFRAALEALAAGEPS